MQEIKLLEKFDVRKLKWNLDDLIERNCPICNQPKSDAKFIRPDGLKVYFCTNCSTYFISPAPSAEQIKSFYENYEVNYRAEFSISNYLIKKTMDNTDPLSDYRIKVINNFVDIPFSKVFDIGFGRARFLYLLKKLGAEPFGNEYDEESIRIAQYLGINNVYHCDISELIFEDYFDLLTLNDIVEHPLEPNKLLENVLKMTKIGGVISIWTPNGSCGENREDNLTFRVDLEHMQYFTKRTFEYLAKKFNLEILHLEPVGTPILFGINRQITYLDKLLYKIKSLVKLIPGFFIMKKLIKRDSKTFDDSFLHGDFILFCIMKKK